MIGKISKGAGFRGCVNYVLGKPDAKLLAAEGVLTDSIQTITDCFQSQRMMKPHIRQPVGHISLSYAPEDASRMTDEILVSLAKEYMQKMGIKETQYIIARHKDQKHPHVHIVFNRVDNNRRTISDKNDCYRNVKVCKELKEKYGLYFGKGKDRVRTHRLKGNDKTKYEIYHAVKYSLSKSNNWKLFISELSRQGIKTEFKYRGKSNVIQGLSLTKDGITFKASGIDRNFSYSKLDKQLGENNNQYQQGIGMTTNNGQPVIQHENTYTSSSNIAESLVGALGGLFTPTFNNADENAEAAFEKFSSMVTCDVYGEDAVEAYANGGGAYFCGFTNDLATLTFDGETSTISGTDKDGNVLFSHTYHYIVMEPVHELYEFESDDADSGEFTYFFLAPDISAETYHIEFRYGSDAEALSQYDTGEYAYWLASGISTDCDQTMIDNCIELFCTENLAG